MGEETFALDCEQSVFVRENPTSDKKSRKYANEGKERGENKARHEKTVSFFFLFLRARASRDSRLRRSLCTWIASDFIIP